MTCLDADNEAILRRMRDSGDHLPLPQGIDFNVVLPDDAAAQALGKHFHAMGLDVSAERTETVPELPWDVVVKKRMLPTKLAFAGRHLAAFTRASREAWLRPVWRLPAALPGVPPGGGVTFFCLARRKSPKKRR